MGNLRGGTRRQRTPAQSHTRIRGELDCIADLLADSFEAVAGPASHTDRWIQRMMDTGDCRETG